MRTMRVALAKTWVGGEQGVMNSWLCLVRRSRSRGGGGNLRTRQRGGPRTEHGQHRARPPTGRVACTMDVITDVLQNVATSYPIGTGVAVLGAVWYALVVLRERAGDASVGGCVTDEGIQKARERQQAALAQAATARAQAASSSCCVPAAPTPKPASTAGEPAGEMPERMRLAAARRAAADAAVAGTSVAGTSGKAKASGMTSNDKNSVTQRLARLQASAIRTAAPKF